MCGLGNASSTKLRECKTVDPRQPTRAIIYPDHMASITLYPQFIGRDVAVGIWKISQPDLENILLISIYWSQEAIELPKKFLDVGGTEPGPNSCGWRSEHPLKALGQRNGHGEGLPGG